MPRHTAFEKAQVTKRGDMNDGKLLQSYLVVSMNH